MTKRQIKSGTIDIKGLVAEDEEFLRALVRMALQEVLRTLVLAQLQARQPLKPYQQLRYWSTVPFASRPAKGLWSLSHQDKLRVLEGEMPGALGVEMRYRCELRPNAAD